MVQCPWQRLEGEVCGLVSTPAHGDIFDRVCSFLRVMVLKITGSWASRERTSLVYIQPEHLWAGTMDCRRTRM